MYRILYTLQITISKQPRYTCNWRSDIVYPRSPRGVQVETTR